MLFKYILIVKGVYYLIIFLRIVWIEKLYMSLKTIFTWWNKQTFGTFLKTFFWKICWLTMSLETNIINL